MSFPKVIHYCWFGPNEIPEKERNCIESWKEHFKDYEFILWNETNFNFDDCKFAKQAYDAKKYAFVSDYARAKILYEHGGLYLDTDVKIIKDFPISKEPNGYMGFERKSFLGTAVIASVPKNENIKELLEYYNTHDFIQEDGSFDNIANVSILTDIMVKKGLVLGGKRQCVDGFEIFNREIFYPKKYDDTSFNITNETVGIHMCSNSWLTDRERKRGNNKIWIEIIRPSLRFFRRVGINIIGKEKIRNLEIKIRNHLK